MSSRDELARWAAHVDWLIGFALLLFVLIVSGCSTYTEPVLDNRSIDQLAGQSGWKHTNVPATCICFKQGDPALVCKVPIADGCAERVGQAVVITTRKPWTEEQIGLIIHEIGHAAGWNHK